MIRFTEKETHQESEMTTAKIVAKDIHSKWGKLTEADVATIKSHDQLSASIVKAYNLDKAKADADVTAWMAGRTF
jgi:HD-GYP domain-containing protein (c-di-GMP phosphodiesterase class II)